MNVSGLDKSTEDRKYLNRLIMQKIQGLP